MLRDENYEGNITLRSANGAPQVFRKVAYIPYGNSEYVILQAIGMANVPEEEGLVFLLEEVGGRESINMITDTETIDAVFDIYELLVKGL